MASDKFRVLRREIKSRGIDLRDLAAQCGVSHSTFYATMRGEREWALEWMYIVMDALELPYSNMDKLFPRRGMYAGELDHKTQTPADHLAAAVREYVRQVVDSQ